MRVKKICTELLVGLLPHGFNDLGSAWWVKSASAALADLANFGGGYFQVCQSLLVECGQFVHDPSGTPYRRVRAGFEASHAVSGTLDLFRS
jgi:hypothetical protein